jgi:4-amino-4-deoxy-L-arabinose transferase-like glycosyltransferase
MNKKTLFLLGLVVLASGTVSFCMLTRGHLWRDDFASYIMQAKSILSGNMAGFIQRNAFTVENSSYPPGPVAYPWGFPLLIAPIYALFGLNVLAFKLVNTLFYMLFLVVFFTLARTRLGAGESVILTSVLAFNPTLLQGHDLILSDFPFLFFSTLGVFLADRFSRTTKFPGILAGLATGTVIFLAFFTRTNGFLLFIPLVISALIACWPHWKAALKRIVFPLVAFGLLLFAQVLIFPNGQESYFSHFSMFSLPHLLDNMLYYLWLPSQTFDGIPGGSVLYPLLLIFLAVSVLRRRERDLPLHLYSLATLGIFILWPERQGLRFIYPVIPLFLLFAFDGVKIAIERIKSEKATKVATTIAAVFFIGLVLVSLGLSVTLARNNLAANREINGPFDPVSNQMFAFVREKTPKDSVVIFYKPRAMRLFTERDAFMTDRCADLPKGDYVVISEKIGGSEQIPPEQVMTCNPAVSLDTVFNNKRFTVYKINP